MARSSSSVSLTSAGRRSTRWVLCVQQIMKRLLPKKCWLIATAAAVVTLGLAFALLAPSSNSRSPVAGVGVSFLSYTNISAQGRSAAFVLTNGCDSAIDYSPALAQVQTDGSWGLFHYPPGGAPTRVLAAHQAVVFTVQVPHAAVWRVPVGVSFPPTALNGLGIRARGLRERLRVWWQLRRGAAMSPKPLDVRVVDTVYSPVMTSHEQHTSSASE